MYEEYIIYVAYFLKGIKYLLGICYTIYSYTKNYIM